MFFWCSWEFQPLVLFLALVLGVLILRHSRNRQGSEKFSTSKYDCAAVCKEPEYAKLKCMIAREDSESECNDIAEMEELDVKDDGMEETCIEDDVADVLLLRKLVKNERRRAETTAAELKKERMAAASAAEEAMAMILKLQSQKCAVEIEAKQYRRLAEHRQEIDREVVQSLQWIITKYEHMMNDLEAKWSFCRRKLKGVHNDDVLEEFDNEILSYLDGNDDAEADTADSSSCEMN